MNNAAMAQAVQRAVAPKFRGSDTLKSKVVTHFPMNLEREYLRIVNTYMTMMNLTLKEYLPTIRRAITAERKEQKRLDSDIDINTLITQTFLDIHAEFERKAISFGLEQKLANLANLNRKLTIREWKRVVQKTLGIDIMGDYYMGEFFRGALVDWTTRNVNLITSIPCNTLMQMQSIIQQGYLAGSTNTSISKAIMEEYGIERSRAQFIARDQMAKLNADLTHAQQKDAGVEEYIWSTSADEKVRARHRELDGKTFSWNDPPIVDTRTGRRGHPGQDFQCRCAALPKFNLPELSLPWDKGV